MAATAGTALADVSHVYSHSIGAAASAPPNPYPISEPSDVAVDQSTGNLYVTDTSNHRVEKFDAAGNFLLMFGKDVNQTTGGDLCTAASGNTCQTGTPGTSPGAFQSPAFLAVDNYPGGEGAVYVGDNGAKLVQKFDSSGHLVTGWGAAGQKDGSDASDLPGFGTLGGLAIGGRCATPQEPKIGLCEPVGTLYVSGNHYSSNVWLYTQNGEYITWLVSYDTRRIKADRSGNIYSAGQAFSIFGGPQLFETTPTRGVFHGTTSYEMAADWPTTGFAFDPSTEELYQGTDQQIPNAQTEQEGLELHGPQINHYGTDCNPPSTGPCKPIDSFGGGHLFGPKGLDVDGGSQIGRAHV